MKGRENMLGIIIALKNDLIKVKITNTSLKEACLINNYIVFEDNNLKVVGEIGSVEQDILEVNLVGEIRNNLFFTGLTNYPSFKSLVRLITDEELITIMNGDELNNQKKLPLGFNITHNNYPIKVDVNKFFSNHLAIFGSTGSGKSYTVAKILQNIFYNSVDVPSNANIFLFDVYGEYHHVFHNISKYSPKLNYKIYTTNLKFPDTEILKIPLWLLGIDDIALLLDADLHIQLPIIEKALRLVTVFATNNEQLNVYKNDIIARAVLEILYSGNTPSQIRDQVFAILTTFNTPDLNLESKLVQPGYIRTLRQCFIVDRDGKLNEIKLVTEFVTGFIKEGLELKLPDGSFPYTLDQLKEAFDFALISEGILKSDKVYDYANILKVRLHSLINSDYRCYFEYDGYISKEDYLKKLGTTLDGKRAQLVNFNISYIDDRLVKVITKIFSKMFYDYVANLKEKGTFPVHIMLEEAHRYVQNDTDEFLLGYNIFNRITKEGRKYGIIATFISQRPLELNETALSQCSNFLIFKMIHGSDLLFIKEMVPDISSDIIEKLKVLPPGTCMAFGNAFKLPMVLKFDLPNPPPLSKNIDLSAVWYENEIEEL